jgi:hypothetical protein
LSGTRLTLALALISAQLSCVLLWAQTGAFAAGALALTLGLGAVLVVFLPERYPPRGAVQGKPLPRAPVNRDRTRGGYRGDAPELLRTPSRRSSLGPGPDGPPRRGS